MIRRIALPLALALLVLPACSGSDDEAVSVKGDAAWLAAAAATTSGTSYTVEMHTEASTTAGQDVTSDGSGARVGDAGTMTMEMPVPGADMSMTFVVTEDGRQFLSYEGVPEEAPLPTGWVELTDAPKASEQAVASSASVDSFLAAFQREGADVEERGTGERDGQKVTRYHTVADLSASMRVETDNRVYKKIMDNAADSFTEVETDIEVDEQGRIVFLEYGVETKTATTRTTILLSDFGVPQSIEAPEPDVTMTFDEFIGLIYASPEPSGEAVDESELFDRDEFVELLADESGLSEDVAGCIYDELREIYPSALIADNDMGEMDQDMAKAMTTATMSCM